MPQNFRDYIGEFLDYLKFQKRFSVNTSDAYRSDLRDFSSFILEKYEDPNIEKASAVYVRTWLASLRAGDNAAKSINRKISSLRSFYKFLLRKGIIDNSPVAAIGSLKTPKRLPQFADEKSTEKLFTEIRYAEGFPGLTEKLILEMLYNTGMRRSELVNVREHHLDRANSSVKVLGKGSKERIIPLKNELCQLLFGYIAEKKSLFGDTEERFLFVNRKGKQISASLVYAVARKYLSLVTTLEKRSPHILRHSFATQLMNNGADINAVKELLGHSSLAATQVYTHNTIEKLKDIYKKAHPKA